MRKQLQLAGFIKLAMEMYDEKKARLGKMIAKFVYKYSVDMYLLCMIKVRVRWSTCSLWKML